MDRYTQNAGQSSVQPYHYSTHHHHPPQPPRQRQQQQQQQQQPQGPSVSPPPPVGYITSPAMVTHGNHPHRNASTHAAHATHDHGNGAAATISPQQSSSQPPSQPPAYTSAPSQAAPPRNIIKFNSTGSINESVITEGSYGEPPPQQQQSQQQQSQQPHPQAQHHNNGKAIQSQSIHRHSYSYTANHGTSLMQQYRPRRSVTSGTSPHGHPQQQQQQQQQQQLQLPSHRSSFTSGAQHRTSIASKISSLTRDSSTRSIMEEDACAMMIQNFAEITHLCGRAIEQTIVQELYRQVCANHAAYDASNASVASSGNTTAKHRNSAYYHRLNSGSGSINAGNIKAISNGDGNVSTAPHASSSVSQFMSSSQALFVHGPWGVGKTAFILDFYETLQNNASAAHGSRYHTFCKGTFQRFQRPAGRSAMPSNDNSNAKKNKNLATGDASAKKGAHVSSSVKHAAINAAGQVVSDAIPPSANGYANPAIPPPGTALLDALDELCTGLERSASSTKIRSLIRRSYANKPNREQRQSFWRAIQSVPKLHSIVGNIPQPNLQRKSSPALNNAESTGTPPHHANSNSNNNNNDDSKTAAPTSTITPQDIQQLAMVFRQILRIVCTSTHPVILFLDDLQYADQASYQFITSLLEPPGIRNFFFIGCFRDDDPVDTLIMRLRNGQDSSNAHPKPLMRSGNMNVGPASVTGTSNTSVERRRSSMASTSSNYFGPADNAAASGLSPMFLSFLESVFAANNTNAQGSRSQHANKQSDAKLHGKQQQPSSITGGGAITTVHGTTTITTSDSPSTPQITTVRLGSLTLDNVQELLSELTASHNASEVTAFAQVIYDHTHGNPASILQFLEMLQRRGALSFSFQTHRWSWSLQDIRLIVRQQQQQEDQDLQNNVENVTPAPSGTSTLAGASMKPTDWKNRIQHVPKEGQTLLRLAACIGMTFDSTMLQYLAMHLGMLDVDYHLEMKQAMKSVVEEAVSGRLIHPDQLQQVMQTQMSNIIEDDGDDASLRQSFYEESLSMSINEAEIQGMIRPVMSTKRTSPNFSGMSADGGPASTTKHRFTDPTIYQYFVDETPAGEERAKLHLGIGQVLRSFNEYRPEDEILFAAIDHLHRGASCYLASSKKRMPNKIRKHGENSGSNKPAISAETAGTSAGQAELVNVLRKEKPGSVDVIDGGLDGSDGNDVLPDSDRVAIIELHMVASDKARSQSAFFLAADVLSRAIDLVKEAHDWKHHYPMMLHLHTMAANADIACGRTETANANIQQVLTHSRSLPDRLDAEFNKLQVLQSQAKLQAAADSTLTVLSVLGVSPPDRMNRRVLNKLMRTVRDDVQSTDESSLLHSVHVQDDQQTQKLRFLSALAMIAYHQADADWLTWSYLEMMRISVRKMMLCRYTPSAFAGYGFLLASLGDMEQAYHYSKLAVSLSDRLENDGCVPVTTWIVYSHLHHLGNSLLDAVSPLLAGYQTGISSGNVAYATRCIASSAAMGFVCALPLRPYREDMKHVCAQLRTLRQDVQWRMAVPFWLVAEEMIGGERRRPYQHHNQHVGEGESEQIREFREQKKEYEDVIAAALHNNAAATGAEKLSVLYHCFLRCMTSYILFQFDEAERWRCELEKRRKKVTVLQSHFLTPMICLFAGLTCFHRFQETRSRKYRRKGRKMRKQLADMINSDGTFLNYQGMLHLLDAEDTLKGSREKRRLYEDAIHAFSNAGWIHLQAVAAERFARASLKLNERDMHQNLLRVSIRLYAEWGAIAKVRQLRDENGLPLDELQSDEGQHRQHSNPHPHQPHFTPPEQQQHQQHQQHDERQQQPGSNAAFGVQRSSQGNRSSANLTRLSHFTPMEGHKEEDYISSDTFF